MNMDKKFQQPVKPVQVLAVTSGKGGAGKTTTSINLAAAMRKLGQEVMIMDADLGLANIDVMLGLRPKFNLSHVLNGEKRLDEVILKGPEGIMIVPAASGLQSMSELSHGEHQGIIHAFSDLENDIDVLIIDTAAGISDSVTSFCKAANEVIVVVCDEPASLADSYAMIKVLNKDHGVEKFHVMSNMVDTDDSGLSVYMRLLQVTERFLNIDIDYLGAVPRDQFQQKANRKQSLVTKAYPRSKSARSWVSIAEKITHWTPDDMPSGNLEFFLERLLRGDTMMEVA